MRAYVIEIQLKVLDAQEADDKAIEIAERIACELGSSRVTVREVDKSTGRQVPLYARAA